MDAGAVFDTATATGTDPYANADSSNSSSVSVPASNASEVVDIATSTTTPYFTGPGQGISYSYLVTNVGTETLSAVAVTDPGSTGISCPDPSLAPGASETCTGAYTTTAADVAAGSVSDSATASADNQSGTPVSSAPSSVTTDLVGLTLTKSTSDSGFGFAGYVIPYSYLVTNTGSATLSGISVADDKVATVSCPDPTLAPGASETCTGTYTVIQDDVDTGSVTNTAIASADPPSGSAITSNSSSVTLEATGAESSLTLAKSTASTGYGAVGDTIPYSYLVTNSGTTTLTGISGLRQPDPLGLVPRRRPWRQRPRRPARDLHGDPGRRGHRFRDQYGHRLGRSALGVLDHLDQLIGHRRGVGELLLAHPDQVDQLDRLRRGR